MWRPCMCLHVYVCCLCVTVMQPHFVNFHCKYGKIFSARWGYHPSWSICCRHCAVRTHQRSHIAHRLPLAGLCSTAHSRHFCICTPTALRGQQGHFSGVFPSAAGNLSVVLLLSHWVVVSFVYQLRRAGLGVEEDRDTGSDHSPRCTSLRSNTGYCHRGSDLPHKGAEPEGIVSSVGDNYIIRTLTSNNSLLFHDVSQYVSTKVIRNWLHMKQTR